MCATIGWQLAAVNAQDRGYSANRRRSAKIPNVLIRNRGCTLRPMLDNIPHHFIANHFRRLQSRQICRVISLCHSLETLRSTSSRSFSVVIADCPQHQHTLKIRASRLTQKGECLQRTAVLHVRNHIISLASGVVACPGVRPFIHFCAVPECAGGECVASGNEWRFCRNEKSRDR